MPSLHVWMNGLRVGEWVTRRAATSSFRYDATWRSSAPARALSLSLPLTVDGEIRGAAVDHFFDNLLPDDADARRELRRQFGLRGTTGSFGLLAAVGHDCAGAVQLLAPEAEPPRHDEVRADRLDESGVAALFDASGAALRRSALPGTQPKCALLWMAGAWHRPLGATPSTHILKRHNTALALENEWLCAQLLREFGLPVARTRLAQIGGQAVLIVKRFDRRWIGAADHQAAEAGFVPARGQWIARLPHEDLCQALGRPAQQKYQADGGPSLDEALNLLARSASADADRALLLQAQLAFWLLAALDGHGKKFSIQHRAGGDFALAPLYNVRSAWPLLGAGFDVAQWRGTRLAMGLPSEGWHGHLNTAQTTHWQRAAQRIGGVQLWHRLCTQVHAVEPVLERVARTLPRGFPEAVFAKIAAGMRLQARLFLAAAPNG